MPVETVYAVSIIVAAFVVFMLTLAWAWARAHEPMPIKG